MVFPVVMYGCESWTVKKAEHRRIDAFELWCWRRLLRVPWTARRSSQSILKEISPGCSLEGMMIKLKLQFFGHLMWRGDSLEIGHEFEWTLRVGDGQGGLACCSSWDHRVGYDWVAELNWTENQTLYLTETFRNICFFQSSCKNPGYRSPGFPCILKEIQSF